jgi:hypothetical protein
MTRVRAEVEKNIKNVAESNGLSFWFILPCTSAYVPLNSLRTPHRRARRLNQKYFALNGTSTTMKFIRCHCRENGNPL